MGCPVTFLPSIAQVEHEVGESSLPPHPRTKRPPLTESTSPALHRAARSPSRGQVLNQVLLSLGPLNEWLISKPSDHTLEASPMLLSRSQFADQVRKTFTRFLCFVQALFFRKVMDALAQHLVEPAEWV